MSDTKRAPYTAAEFSAILARVDNALAYCEAMGAPETQCEQDRRRLVAELRQSVGREKLANELAWQADDRAEKAEAELTRAREALRGLVSSRHGHEAGCMCPWCNARAALGEEPADGDTE